MNAFFYLKTCNTCKRILDTLDLPEAIELRDIKSNPITASELEHLQSISGSYESLFSKRAQLYKKEGLKDKNLSESDFKHYILQHYTFLKRPVLVYQEQIFIGNSTKTIEAAKDFIRTHEH